MDANTSFETGSNKQHNHRSVSGVATRAHRGLTGRNVGFWSTLAVAPVAIGLGIAGAMGSRRAGVIAGAISALGIAALRFQFQRWFTAEPSYEVEQRIGDLEIRRYLPRVEARTQIASESFDDALNEGFDRLAGYIFGGNLAGESLSMTAPVITKGERLAMTAPVITSIHDGGHVMAFVLQPDRTIDSLPQPRDARVTLVEMPERRVAVLGYRGRYRGDVVEAHQRVLRQLVAEAGLPAKGEPSFAGFDPPWTIPLLRRNEVWIELV